MTNFKFEILNLKFPLLLALSSLVWASPVRAELLFEVSYDAIWRVQGEKWGPGLGMVARVGNTQLFYTDPDCPCPPFQVVEEGYEQSASPELLALIQGALTTAVAPAFFSSGVDSGNSGAPPPSNSISFDATNVWDKVTAHVTQLGFGLVGYTLSEVTNTLESVEWTNECGSTCDHWLAETTTTVRFFGEIGLAGDANGDGTVDAADYITIREAGSDPFALLMWRNSFGVSAPQAGGLTAGSVPEPTSIGLLLVAHAIVLLRPYRRPACRPIG